MFVNNNICPQAILYYWAKYCHNLLILTHRKLQLCTQKLFINIQNCIFCKQQHMPSGNTLLKGQNIFHNLLILVSTKLKLCTQTLSVNIKLTSKLHVCKQQQTASGNTLI